MTVEKPFVSRAGEKLAHALREFQYSPSGLRCADFGCNVGGFTDCLLRNGAARVFALDTGYGILDWRLRNDGRVAVMERTNALHAPAPGPDDGGPVDLVVIDLAWTPQRLGIPAAIRWLNAAPGARIISLVKPHYEVSASGGNPRKGVLEEAESQRVLDGVIATMPGLGVRVLGVTTSPISGGAKTQGNTEYLIMLERAAG